MKQQFHNLWYSSVNVYERTGRLRDMSLFECQLAVRVDDYAHRHKCWYTLQPSVRRALESRVRVLLRTARARTK